MSSWWVVTRTAMALSRPASWSVSSTEGVRSSAKGDPSAREGYDPGRDVVLARFETT